MFDGLGKLNKHSRRRYDYSRFLPRHCIRNGPHSSKLDASADERPDA